jgi:hypothetical protein
VSSSRNINTSLVVTVISACLGLVVVGVPAHTLAEHLATTTDAAQLVKKRLEDSIISKLKQPLPKQARQLPATHNPQIPAGIHYEHRPPAVILYHNTKALADNNQVLIVTHLPRAALSELLARKPEAD